jgi:hypothetical protein
MTGFRSDKSRLIISTDPAHITNGPYRGLHDTLCYVGGA